MIVPIETCGRAVELFASGKLTSVVDIEAEDIKVG